MLRPGVPVGLGSGVTIQMKVFAQQVQLALDRAEITIKSRLLHLCMQLFRRDPAIARNATQQLNSQQRGFQRPRSLPHGVMR